METPQARRKIPVVSHEEERDDAVGQSHDGALGLDETEEDTQGQTDILKKRDPGDRSDDTES